VNNCIIFAKVKIHLLNTRATHKRNNIRRVDSCGYRYTYVCIQTREKHAKKTVEKKETYKRLILQIRLALFCCFRSLIAEHASVNRTLTLSAANTTESANLQRARVNLIERLNSEQSLTVLCNI